MTIARLRVWLAACAVLVSLAAPAWAQKTDIVVLSNGDRITGEIKELERGQLEFSTDDAGTLYLEWDKLASLLTTRNVEVVTGDGLRYFGSLGTADRRSLVVVSTDGQHPLAMQDVTIIRPIGTSFWKKIDGSVDAGFSYTRSSGIAQLNVNWETVYNKPSMQGRLAFSLTATKQDDGSSDDRGYLELSYLKYPWRTWFVAGAGRFESNESLGLTLRSQIAGIIGPRLINSNRAQMTVGGGLVFNDEQGVDVESTQNIEAVIDFRWSYFRYDRPKTNLDLSIDYYPSLSTPGRHRLQLDAGARREFFKDLFVAVNGYNTYDSQPPNPTADTNDVGVVISVGWSY